MLTSEDIRERLVALDRAAIGRAYDAPAGASSPWLVWLAAGYPVVTGGVTAAVFSQSRAAGAGVLIGLVLGMPLAFFAKRSSSR